MSHQPPPLEDLFCAVEVCEHRLREHGKNGRCYGVRLLEDGRVFDCPCRKFRMPQRVNA